MAESTVPTRCTKSQPWFSHLGVSRHERLLRKHIPDSDPGCALQSTSMPALHRRNLPNCRPMAEGGTRKCSAVEDFARRGACPPLGSGWGVAESAAPIRCTKPQLRLFTPWCAGNNVRLLLCVPDYDPVTPTPQFGTKAHPGLRSGMCPPINLDAGTPPAEPAELQTDGRRRKEKM